MTTIVKRLWIFLLPLLAAGAVSAQATDAVRDRGDLDAEARAAVVARIATLLDANYVFPETGKKMSDHIRGRLEAGDYDRYIRSSAFAGRLTSDLREISRDLHLRVRHDPATAAALLRGGHDGEELQRMRRQRERRNNYGFEKVEVLAGNTGYLDLRYFADTAYAKDTAAAAMNFLANADAVIVDLRSNGGGSPRMVQFLCSYFFGSEPVHLNSLYWRPSDRTDEFWTLRELPGRRMPEVPLYILTSRRTFSGAEEFTYNMRNLKRATVVGETTGGGAHPVNMKAVDERIVISIPVGRAINPVSGTNWEGVGVKPHVETPRDQALARAHLLALKTILASTRDDAWNSHLRRLISQIESDLSLSSSGWRN